MRLFFLGICIFFLAACSVKKAKKNLASGDYDAVIVIATTKLQSNKTSKGNQAYVYMLEEAFVKAKSRDTKEIDFLKKEGNPEHLEKIYVLYNQLNDRQEKITPLLPLKLIKENRKAVFNFEEYGAKIIESKRLLSDHLYNKASRLLGVKSTKLDARTAYDDLIYLEKINPNFKNTRELLSQAKFKGTDNVLVSVKNESDKMLPVRLERDILDLSTYGINSPWAIYHSKKLLSINYDYGIVLYIRQLEVSPEQIKEKQFIKEKQIKDGEKFLLDKQGNPVKDATGKTIKVDNMKEVKISIYEFNQFKSAMVAGRVDFTDFKTKQLLETIPIQSEFVFEHSYATYTGDRLACDESYLPFFTRKSVPFPSNEQMIFDTSTDLKQKLKAIISNSSFLR